MHDWLVTQLDYIFFWYGLSFLLLAINCLGQSRHSESSPLAWRWLGVFGLLHGIAEWLLIVTIGMPAVPILRLASRGMVAVSFLALAEFARCSGPEKHKSRAHWIMVGLAGLTGLGWVAGPNGFEAASRYCLGFPAALWAAWTLARADLASQCNRRWGLRLAAISLIVYALAAGLVGPNASFWPACRFNQEVLLQVVGIPIQLIRAACAAVCAVGIWMHGRRLFARPQEESLFARWAVPALLLVTIVLGWIGAEWRGQIASNDIRQNLLRHVAAIARAVPSERVHNLSFTLADRSNPIFQRIRSQMTAYGRYTGLRSIYSMAIRNGAIVFGPENLDENDPVASPPGTVYRQPAPEHWEMFRSGQARTLGPFTDEYGTFVSGLAPVFEPRSGKVLLVIGVDILANQWDVEIAAARMMAILPTLLVSAILLAGVIVLRWRPKEFPPAQWWFRYTEAILTAAVGLAITAIATGIVVDARDRKGRDDFLQLADAGSQAICQALEETRRDLKSVSRFLADESHTSRVAFESFARPLADSSLVQEWGWIPCVPRDAKAQFEAKMRKGGYASFRIFEKDATGAPVPVTRRDTYYPIAMVTPLEGNEPSLGFDLGSERVRREALEETIATGFATASAPAHLVQEPEGQQGVLILHPALRPRETRPYGFIDCAIRPQAALTQVLENNLRTTSYLDFHLLDISDGQSPAVLAEWPVKKASQPPARLGLSPKDISHCSLYPLFFFGRTWVMVAMPAPGFLAWYQSWTGLAAGLSGLVLTLAMTCFVAFLCNRADHDLRESQSRLANVIKGTNAGLWEWNIQSGELVVNDRWAEIVGYTLEELAPITIGTWQNLCDPQDLPEQMELLKRHFRGELAYYDRETHIRHKGGQWVWVHVRGKVVEWTADGKPLRMSGTHIDITRRKEAEEQLQGYVEALASANQTLEDLNRAAEAATRAKSEFLANMSHEIRTPMTAILGYTELLAASVESPDQQEAIQIIQRNGDHLLTLINDILDLSKIEAGKLHVECIACSPLAILDDLISLFRVRAEAKGLSLELTCSGPIPQTIHTDPTRLRQILVNLVGNAIKFTETGYVRVVTTLLDRESRGPQLQFAVIDTGIGISDRQKMHLFQAFHQADTSMTRRFGGTGLGLVISKRLANALGGDIEVRSERGAGSEFRVTIATGPLEGVPLVNRPSEMIVAPAPKPREAASACLNCRILLAEDGPDNQRLISLILHRAGAEVEIAPNGQRAMEMALATYPGWGRRQDDPEQPFDVILMDMQMPVMDGYEATRRLRESGYRRPILALTAHAMRDDLQKCLDAGCDACLTKPIEREKFLATVAEYAARCRAKTALPEHHTTEPPIASS